MGLTIFHVHGINGWGYDEYLRLIEQCLQCAIPISKWKRNSNAYNLESLCARIIYRGSQTHGGLIKPNDEFGDAVICRELT